jgi:hypothetical protein
LPQSSIAIIDQWTHTDTQSPAGLTPFDENFVRGVAYSSLQFSS